MERIAEVLKNWVQIHLRELKTGKSPHVSFITSRIISHPTSYGLLKDLSVAEIIKLSYVVFFMFEGDDYNTAKSKADQMQIIEVVEVGDIKYKVMECDECYGDGTVECQQCDGEGEIDCYECGGTGESGEDDCEYCNGTGKVTCDDCEGNKDTYCEYCDGDGEVESSYDEVVEFSTTYWGIYEPRFVSVMKEKKDNPKINTDFYSDADSEGTFGDLTIIASQSTDEMDREDFERIYGNYEVGDSFVHEITPFDKWSLKDKVFIRGAGSPNAMTRL